MKPPESLVFAVQSRCAAQVAWLVLLAVALSAGLGALIVLPMLRPAAKQRPGIAREAIGFAGTIPLAGDFLTTHHSAGRDAMLPGKRGQEAMTGDAFERWIDLAPIAGGTLLTVPDGAVQPVLKRMRLDSVKGELRFASFGPGAWLEGKAEAGAKGLPLDSAYPEPTLSVIQMVRFRPEPGGSVSTVQLANSSSGQQWVDMRASWDGSFEVFLGPARRPIKVTGAGPAGRFFIVGLTWEAKKLTGKAVLTVRPEGGGQRKTAEIKYVPPGSLEPLDQVRLGEKTGASSGVLEVLETLVFNRNLRPEHLRAIEDWLYRHHVGGVPLEANGSVP